MRVCLITPPSAFLIDQRVFVSLGILRVAAALDDVEHLDLNGVADFAAAAESHAYGSRASVFGLTATTPQMPGVVAIVAAIRRARPEARIVLGGPHATLVAAAAKRGVPRATRALDALGALVDVVVAGDGERAILAALAPDAPWLIDADDPKSQWWVKDQDALPPPRRDLVDLSTYRYEIDGARATSVVAQLGCPFECAFCGGRSSPMLRRIRTRSTENVAAEVRGLAAAGFKGVMFYDDELNVNRSMIPLMDAIAPLGLRLRGFIKAELFTDDQAAAMVRAGFRWILVGFESGSPRILQNINKKATVADNTRCLEIARRHGLKVKALMSIGHAGESADTVQETEDWLLATKPDDFDCTIISTYPGTPYFDEAVSGKGCWTYTAPRSGDRLHAEDVDFLAVSEFYKGRVGHYQSFVWTDHLTASEIVSLRDKLEIRVRLELGMPSASGGLYEASMGQVKIATPA